MLSAINSNTSFNGTLSEKAIKMAENTLGQEGYKLAKKFRAGKNKFDKISIKYETTPATLSYGKQYLKTDTYMEVANSKSKQPPFMVCIAKDVKLPFGQKMLDLITEKMAFIDKLRKQK